ncbi:VanZ family protein [Lactococcus lactis subsp. lactis]|uniref:VanZ family protein n=1 Tax=Lactococcus lactis TaxID=1358 RepID=UPI0009C27DBC|nr:VanZ family protein [Lactococcus lactis]ARD94564.1 VanZ family protein [Lactococcus lactis subsp. lactis]MRL66797.1 VanZ family protein [Lactococcus lactis subsp. lactis]
MQKFIIYFGSLLVTFSLSYATITWLIMPVLTRYPNLLKVIDHFDHTALTLILLLTLIVWLFGIQYHLKRFSVIYLYLAFSVYALLLFMVLFTKTTDFQAISLNPFDFIKADTRTIQEAVLNIIYFIPLGGLYCINTDFKQFVIISLITLLGIETIQFIFYLGTFAISDIILNFLGCLSGYYCCQRMKNTGENLI